MKLADVKEMFRTTHLYTIDWKILTPILVCIIFFVSFAYSGIQNYIEKKENKIRILKPINIRPRPSLDCEPITYLPASDEYKILEIKQKYYQVKILTVSRHINKIGWVHHSVGFISNSYFYISGKGCTLRSTPEKKNNNIAFIINGAKCGILDMTDLWYKINRIEKSNWKNGWVYNLKNYVEKIK